MRLVTRSFPVGFPWTKAAWTGLAVACCAGYAASVQAPSEQIGVVRQAVGHWVRQGSPQQKLGPGDRVFGADTIRNRPSWTLSNRIVVLLHDGTRVLFACDSPCMKPFVPADSLPRSSLASRALSGVRRALMPAVMQLLSEKKPGYSIGISRGEGGTRLREAVLALDKDGVDLAPAFHEMPRGPTTLCLRPVLPGEATPAAARTVPPGRVHPLDPGLYDVRASERPGCGELDSSGAPQSGAWVLISRRHGGYSEAAAAFDDVRRLSDEWPGAGQGETRSFLRATLEHLAATRGEEPGAP